MPADPIPPATLVDAVAEVFRDTPALIVNFPGNVRRLRPDREPTAAWAEVRDVSARPSAGTARDWLDLRFRFTVYAEDVARAISLRQAIEAAFDGRTLAHAAGYTTAWRVANRSDEQPDRPAWPRFPFRATLDFAFHEHQGV